jgi:hypothetical protein
MADNKHSRSIPPEVSDGILRKQREINETLVEYAVPLTPEERRDIPKMGEKTLSFVEKAFEFATENADLRPPYLNMEEFRTDYSDATGLRVLENNTQQTLDLINDIALLAGSESYVSALAFYGYVKMLAEKDVPRAKTVYEELKKRFPFGRRKTAANEK